MNKNITYILTAILAFIGGIFLYKKNQKDLVDKDFNKTLAKVQGNSFFLLFNGAILLSREITKDEYRSFISKYPTGKAEGNVLNNFSSPPNRYTAESGKYYEYIWNGQGYDSPIEITRDEYYFRRKDKINSSLMEEITI